MLDIADNFTTDFILEDNNCYKARNILNVQVGSLWFEKDFGIDLKFYVFGDLEFSYETFNFYLINTLINYGIDVNTYTSVLDNFINNLQIELKGSE